MTNSVVFAYIKKRLFKVTDNASKPFYFEDINVVIIDWLVSFLILSGASSHLGHNRKTLCPTTQLLSTEIAFDISANEI